MKKINFLFFIGLLFIISGFNPEREKFVVLIDAGHGGKDMGAEVNSETEKEVLLELIKELHKYQTNDIVFQYTRKYDELLSLEGRTDFINQVKPDLLISLHANKAKSTATNGVEAYYLKHGEFENNSKEYATEILEGIAPVFNSNRGVKASNFYILREANCPAIHVELGFLSNEEDREVLTTKRGQKKLAKKLGKAISGLI